MPKVNSPAGTSVGEMHHSTAPNKSERGHRTSEKYIALNPCIRPHGPEASGLAKRTYVVPTSCRDAIHCVSSKPMPSSSTAPQRPTILPLFLKRGRCRRMPTEGEFVVKPRRPSSAVRAPIHFIFIYPSLQYSPSSSDYPPNPRLTLS